jgi:hypothetical protein
VCDGFPVSPYTITQAPTVAMGPHYSIDGTFAKVVTVENSAISLGGIGAIFQKHSGPGGSVSSAGDKPGVVGTVNERRKSSSAAKRGKGRVSTPTVV